MASAAPQTIENNLHGYALLLSRAHGNMTGLLINKKVALKLSNQGHGRTCKLRITTLWQSDSYSVMDAVMLITSSEWNQLMQNHYGDLKIVIKDLKNVFTEEIMYLNKLTIEKLIILREELFENFENDKIEKKKNEKKENL